MSTHKEIQFADVTIYDPISEKTFSGYQTYLETGRKYNNVVYGTSSWGVADGEIQYYVHKICIPNNYALLVGHPFIIGSPNSDIQLLGILTSFVQESGEFIPISAEYGSTGDADNLKYSANHRAYHLIFSATTPLDFFSMVEGIKELNESKT